MHFDKSCLLLTKAIPVTHVKACNRLYDTAYLKQSFKKKENISSIKWFFYSIGSSDVTQKMTWILRFLEDRTMSDAFWILS